MKQDTISTVLLTRPGTNASRRPRRPAPSPTPSIASTSPVSVTFPPSLLHQSSSLEGPPSIQSSFTDQSDLGDDDLAVDLAHTGTIGNGLQAGSLSWTGLPSSTPSLVNDTYTDNASPLSTRTRASSYWHDTSPMIADALLPHADPTSCPSDATMCDQGSAMSGLGQDTLVKLESDPPFEEDDVEEIIREPENTDPWLVPMTPTFSSSSSSSNNSWMNAMSANLFGQPKLHLDSDEMLMAQFDTQTCGILSIKDGPTENPWRTVLWPLAQEEIALRHAIISMTAFHASKDNSSLKTKGLEHMTQSLQLLSHRMNTMEPSTSLATTLVLAWCESWDMLVSTGIKHLQGAKVLVAQILENYKSGRILPAHERRLGFLVRTWVYMDVIARLTSLESDDSEDFDIVCTPLCQPSTINCEVDILMGCASTMFPIIGRVANLVREIRQRSQGNSLQIISRGKILKSRLEKWKAPPMFETPEDASTEVEQALWTAEAYRGATLLYLLQSVPEICYDSVTDTIAALAKEVLTNIANVPETSRAVIIHIFPLLAAGCEAVDPESRAFVRTRWEAMIRRMKIQNLDKCLDVMKEVWDRRDTAVLENQRRRARQSVACLQNGLVPSTVMKRRHSPDEAVGGERRRVSHGNTESTSSVGLQPGFLRRESTDPRGRLDYELTVRGRQHWAGVMKDFRWEGEAFLFTLSKVCLTNLGQCSSAE